MELEEDYTQVYDHKSGNPLENVIVIVRIGTIGSSSLVNSILGFLHFFRLM